MPCHPCVHLFERCATFRLSHCSEKQRKPEDKTPHSSTYCMYIFFLIFRHLSPQNESRFDRVLRSDLFFVRVRAFFHSKAIGNDIFMPPPSPTQAQRTFRRLQKPNQVRNNAHRGIFGRARATNMFRLERPTSQPVSSCAHSTMV